jgi:hypothetical protein
VSDRTVGNWLNGKTCPDDLDSIERVVFGRNPAHDADRLRLREAFEAATRRGEGAASVDPLIPPDRCFGRDADIAALTAVLTGPRAAAVAVLGPPGIGKTTLTRQVATGPAVVERFGERRWLVQLKTTTDAAALRTAVLLAIGLDPASRSFRDALARLSARPRVLSALAPTDGMAAILLPSLLLERKKALNRAPLRADKIADLRPLGEI